MYLFLNKRRRIAKALWFDGSGWCVLAKRLEAGSFQLPLLDGDKPQVVIDGSAFASLLAGIDFTAARRGWYRRPRFEKARKDRHGSPSMISTRPWTAWKRCARRMQSSASRARPSARKSRSSSPSSHGSTSASRSCSP
ncbi:MAG: IS66 family insertion sequence element accessory protein TnpB [Myxococcales bacterium]|nr:IS66 family insertion sequence element accessory protein TnpB [Myxococcales bacterium]